MIRAVTVVNHLNESLRMDLFDPEKSGLLVSNVTGVGGPEADINAITYAVADGEHFSSARANARVITLVLKPVWTSSQSVETSRQLTYRYFPIKHKVKLIFETDNHTLEIEGYVKQNDATIFNKESYNTIAVKCPSPWFYAVGDPPAVVFSGIAPAFGFPFANNKTENDTQEITHTEYDEFGRVINTWTETVVLENTKGLLKMGELKEEKSQVINYDGEIEVGVVVTIQALADGISNILIWKQETSEFIRIDTSKIESVTGSAFRRGESLKISTVSGNRYLKIIRGNGETNIISALDMNSSWIQLTSGNNTFYYAADSGVDDMAFKMEYKTAYQGV